MKATKPKVRRKLDLDGDENFTSIKWTTQKSRPLFTARKISSHSHSHCPSLKVGSPFPRPRRLLNLAAAAMTEAATAVVT